MLLLCSLLLFINMWLTISYKRYFYKQPHAGRTGNSVRAKTAPPALAGNAVFFIYNHIFRDAGLLYCMPPPIIELKSKLDEEPEIMAVE